MPFKKDQNIGKDNHKFNPNKEHGIKTRCTFEEATIYVTDKMQIVNKVNYQGQPIVYYTDDVNDARDFAEKK